MTTSKVLIKDSTQTDSVSRIPWQQVFTVTGRLTICICLLTASVQLHHYGQNFGGAALPSVGQFCMIVFLFLLAWLTTGWHLGWITAFALLATLSF